MRNDVYNLYSPVLSLTFSDILTDKASIYNIYELYIVFHDA